VCARVPVALARRQHDSGCNNAVAPTGVTIRLGGGAGTVEHLEELMIDLKKSLEREIGNLRKDIAEIAVRFDNQALRLDRHAALWQTGRRWSTRMDDWAEKVDAALETKDRQIADLRRRVDDLERGAKK